VPLCGEVEGCVEFDSKDPVGLRGVDGGEGVLSVLTVTKWFCRRDTKRVRLTGVRALPLFQSAPVMQHLRTLTIIHAYALKKENFLSWMVMLVGEPVARLRSSANPWPG
jgi:hypothetical protein